MSKKIIIISVFLSNIVFASVLPLNISQNNANTNQLNTLSNMAGLNLYKRGLDKKIAQQKISKSLQGDEYTNDLMAQNITENFAEITKEDIVTHISNSALYEKSVDLSSYSNIISLVQKSNKLVLDKENLEKIQKISLENTKIKSSYRAFLLPCSYV
ncbi:hypothetical protein KKG72_02215 [bacterium]|nr:hypothetical protein [bacterium]MBU1995024.1 hypothetical protein [bacterium]